jgi:hypothetical protein
MAQRDPARAILELEGSDDGHPLLTELPEEQKDALIGQARDQQDANRIDAQAAPLVQQQQVQRASDQAERAIVNGLLSGNASVTANAVLGNETLTPDAKDRMIGAVARATQPEPSPRVSGDTTLDLLDRIRRRDGDPDKIADIGPIIEAYNGGKLSKTDFKYVAKQLDEAVTPEGQVLARKIQAFITGIRASTDADRQGAATDDESGPATPSSLYELEREIDQRIDQYRTEGRPE